MKTLNITDFSSIFDDSLHFMSIPITSRIKNGLISDIRIHKIDSKSMIDKNIQTKIENYYIQNNIIIQTNLKKIANLLNRDFAKVIASQQYYLLNNVKKLKYNTKDLLYIMELELYNETASHIGDKFANRYANKGVVSYIVPNDLRPIAINSNKPIDYISGPISVISRMNFGQIPEALLAKAITKAEEMILHNPEDCANIISKLSKVALVLGDSEYSNNINQLSKEVLTSSLRRDQFLASVRSTGLYFEAPNFSSFDMASFQKTVSTEFNITANEPILIKRDLLILLKKELSRTELNVDLPIPKNDIILNDIFVGPIYVLKLKQEADSRLTSRDFGAYNAINKQPKQGRSRDGSIGQGSKLGQMEFDGLLAHNCIKTIRELRTVKNDVQPMKFDLANQILTTGTYNLPDVKKTSTIKLIIDGLIEFLNA
jgi:DNA-directed RNA polymerase beta subunit